MDISPESSFLPLIDFSLTYESGKFVVNVVSVHTVGIPS